MPSTINPCQFLVENVLRYHALFAHLQGSEFGPDAVGSDQGRFLRRLIPPHETLLLLIELTGPEEQITMDELDDTGESWDAVETQTDSLSPSLLVDAFVSATYV